MKRSISPLRRGPKPLSPPEKKRQSLWMGPMDPSPKGGITNSLLCKFLICRERFRLKTVEGLKEQEDFKYYMHYGSMWHECEEAYAARKPHRGSLYAYAEKLRAEYPGNDAVINKWAAICEMQFPLYVNYWKTQPLTSKRIPLIEEKVFHIPYQLPSGRIVYLRGKFDSVFMVPSPTHCSSSIYLKENKTKGKIDEEGLQKTVDQNIQTMIYQTALRQLAGTFKESLSRFKGKPQAVLISATQYFEDVFNHPSEDYEQFFKRLSEGAKVVGTLYNVVRRPLSDQHAIRQRKGGKGKPSESDTDFIKRIAAGIKSKPAHNFFQWRCLISDTKVTSFQRECLNPILEQLCDWWESIKANPFDPWWTRTNGNGLIVTDGSYTFTNKLHYRFPFGIYNSLTDGMRGDYFDYLTLGQTSRLIQVDNLFPELQEH